MIITLLLCLNIGVLMYVSICFVLQTIFVFMAKVDANFTWYIFFISLLSACLAFQWLYFFRTM